MDLARTRLIIKPKKNMQKYSDFKIFCHMLHFNDKVNKVKMVSNHAVV